VRVWLLIEGTERRRCSLPAADADHAVASGACPNCGAEGFKVQGTGMRPSVDDRAWEADAVAACCSAHVGALRVETNTLFGVREDEAVLRGRCRVY
jgi:hypothetical protein